MIRRVPTPAARRLVAALLCAAVSGCGGGLLRSHAPPGAVFLLSAAPAESAAPAAARPDIAADLALLRPRVRAGLEGDGIALLYPDHRLEHLAAARWSAPVDVMVEDLALQSLRTGARFRSVGAEASAFASAWWLELEVVDFEADCPDTVLAPVIHVHLLARLGRGDDRRLRSTFESDVTRPASANRVGAIVQAYQRAAAAALAELTVGVARAVSGQEVSPAPAPAPAPAPGAPP